MPTYAYIDESGTMPEHEVMTVSLVLLEGKRTGDHISQRVLKKLYPHLENNLKVLSQKKLHFADMSNETQNQVARIISKEKISGVINCHWHAVKEEVHQVRFNRYVKMLQSLLFKALEITSGDLVVVIAEQGSPDSYRNELFSELRKIVDEFHRRFGVFRHVEFELKSANNVRGLQLADFYAGTVRKMWLESSGQGVEVKACNPYCHLEHQITLTHFLD